MRSTFKAVAMAAMLGGASALGANGSHLISISPKATAMGGTGVGHYTGDVDALYRNPALLGERPAGERKVSAELVGNFYKPSFNANVGAGGANSNTNVQILPALGASYAWTDSLSVGLAALAYGGNRIDYTGNASLTQIKTEHSLMRLIPAASYKVNDWLAVGAGPFIEYATLATNEAFVAASGQSNRKPDGDVGVGGHFGVVLKPTKGLTMGLTYTTKSKVKHEDLINLSLLGKTPNPTRGAVDDITVESPAEIGAGVAYDLSEALRVVADYRFIGWSRADGQSDLQWKDQHVIGLGAQYQMEKLALRAGFNYGASPIQNTSGENGEEEVRFQGTLIKRYNMSKLNVVAFPGISQSHITLGGGYRVSDALSVDLAFQYAPKVTITRSGTSSTPAAAGGPGVGTYTFTVSSTQWGVGAGARYEF